MYYNMLIRVLTQPIRTPRGYDAATEPLIEDKPSSFLQQIGMLIERFETIANISKAEVGI